MKGAELGSHLWEDCRSISDSLDMRDHDRNGTIESGVHAADVDQKANHGHAHCTRTIREQLLLENFACLAASGHGVDVDF